MIRRTACAPAGRLQGARCARVAMLALVVLARSAAAQTEIVLSGRVIDTAGVAVPGLDVVLHRVAESGGARLAEATADSLGRFTLRATEEPVPGAVYFVATRLDSRLYVGPIVRPPLPREGYDVIVGGEPVDFGGIAMPAARTPVQVAPPANARRWLLAIIPAIGLVIVAFVLASRARGPSGRRRLLIRIAQLDVAAASGGDADVQQERERLVEQLLTSDD